MKLIIGLGNPGKRYVNTPHNIGFRVVEQLALRYNGRLKKRLFGNAREAQVIVRQEKFGLIQPLTFMNLSGSCVLGYMRKLKISDCDILVVCDDINLPLGKVRIRPQGSAGGHNGLESIVRSLGTQDFPRLRLGVDTGARGGDLAEYVLSDFRKGEAEIVNEAIEKAVDACEGWGLDGIDKVMNVFN